jgi:hypothetical protein
LAQIQQAQSEETTETLFPERVRLVDNVEANRLQIFFPEIPAESLRRELKQNGFRWSPGEHFKTGAMRPSSEFPTPVRFAFPDTSE